MARTRKTVLPVWLEAKQWKSGKEMASWFACQHAVVWDSVSDGGLTLKTDAECEEQELKLDKHARSDPLIEV